MSSGDVDAATRDAIRANALEAIATDEAGPWQINLALLAALEGVEAERDTANARILAQHRRIVELERDGRRLCSQVWTVRDVKATVEADNARLAERCSTLTDAARQLDAALEALPVTFSGQFAHIGAQIAEARAAFRALDTSGT